MIGGGLRPRVRGHQHGEGGRNEDIAQGHPMSFAT
jgi:hypothetical protein